MVLFELVVPVVAVVPAPRKRLAMAGLVVRKASIISTVRGESLALPRANYTTFGGWVVCHGSAGGPVGGSVLNATLARFSSSHISILFQ